MTFEFFLLRGRVIFCSCLLYEVWTAVSCIFLCVSVRQLRLIVILSLLMEFTS